MGDRWQIIFGHGRVEALRRLRNEARTEAARSGYSKVRAEDRSGVSDEQMVVLGLMENIQREDISPVDCAAALARLRLFRPQLTTTEDIAREMRMEHTKVKRLLRLNAAPQLIKNAVTKGKTFVVPIGDEDSDPKLEHREPEQSARTQEVRKLDLSSALSLARLYLHWSKGGTEQTASDGTPDERMAALIDRVLTQEWGVRRVRLEVAKLAHGEAESSEIDESSSQGEKDSVPFKVKRTKLVIFTSRLEQMNDAQKAELKSALQPIWNQLGAQIQIQPAEALGPLHWIHNLAQLRRDWKAIAQGCRKLWRIFEKFVLGAPPNPSPGRIQLPSFGDQRSSKADSHPRHLPAEGERAAPNAVQLHPIPISSSQQPVALLPTGQTEARPTTGSEQRLSS